MRVALWATRSVTRRLSLQASTCRSLPLAKAKVHFRVPLISSFTDCSDTTVTKRVTVDAFINKHPWKLNADFKITVSAL